MTNLTAPYFLPRFQNTYITIGSVSNEVKFLRQCKDPRAKPQEISLSTLRPRTQLLSLRRVIQFTTGVYTLHFFHKLCSIHRIRQPNLRKRSFGFVLPLVIVTSNLSILIVQRSGNIQCCHEGLVDAASGKHHAKLTRCKLSVS